MEKKEKTGRISSILLTLLACLMLIGFAWAVPSGDVDPALEETWEDEEETGEDEYDFL